MDTLNLLWELETHNLNLDKHRSELESLKGNSDIIDLKIRLNNIEKSYDKQRDRLEEIKEIIRKSELLLKNHEFSYKEKKNLLYRGNIMDIKQLEQLAREEKELKIDIDSLESEIIKNLEEVDSMEEEMDKLKDDISLMNKKMKNQFGEMEEKILNLENLIGLESDSIKSISLKIDDKSLDLYEKLRKHKSKSMVEVKDDICTGCNMRIPSYQKNPLSEGKEIVICESCGRIIFRMKE